MGQFVPVAKLDQLTAERGLGIEVKGRLIALFLHEGKVHALEDLCPHMGAPLAEGHVCDGVVSCRWHGWRFRVTDGVWHDAPKSGQKVETHAVKVEGDQVFLDVTW